MTKDRDFLHLLFEQGPPPQVIWLRVGNSSNQTLQAVLVRTLKEAVASLREGEPWVDSLARLRLAASAALGAASAPRSHLEGVLWNDLALGPALFHWESQSITTTVFPTGQRYIHHASRPGAPTEPFACLGFARYESHEGERPMARGNLCGGSSARSRRLGCTAVVLHTSCCLA